VDVDHLSDLSGLPKDFIVVGAGVVGLEYASFLAALGSKVVLIDERPVILDFVDREIIETLLYHLRQLGITFRLREKVTRVAIDPGGERVFANWKAAREFRAMPLSTP
jgi:NAD(P) transhydrogenase